MSVVIHHRPSIDGTANAAGIYVDSIDRGPKGDKGDTGDKGDKGDKGDIGVGVMKVYVDEADHLITEFSDGSKHDAGEMPKILTKRVFVGEIVGNNTIPLVYDGKPVEINQNRVSHILINGVVYTDNFNIADGNITLSIDPLPTGKLEIFTNTHGISTEGAGAVTSVNGKVGDVEIQGEVEPIQDYEIDQVVNEEGA